MSARRALPPITLRYADIQDNPTLPCLSLLVQLQNVDGNLSTWRVLRIIRETIAGVNGPATLQQILSSSVCRSSHLLMYERRL